ncbi:MAG: helix-turn-helix transcriptional regulator [Saprospiraceae bacterium]
METNPIHIKFSNRQNPKAGFDIIKIEEIFSRDDINHSPSQLHIVEFYIILLIEDGVGKHTIDFTDYRLKKGTLLTIRKDQIHRFHNNSSTKGILLLFTDEFLVSYLEKVEALKSMQLFNELIGFPKIQLSAKELLEISEIVKRLREEYFDVNDFYSLSIIRSELQILIAKLFRVKADKKQIISNRKYLNEFVAFQKLVEQNVVKHTKVKEYAQMMGYSTKTLNAITNTILNKSAKTFIDEICTKQIKRLLINTTLPIKEIAYASGFEETTNFYKYFKRQTQLTPEQFRQQSS